MKPMVRWTAIGLCALVILSVVGSCLATTNDAVQEQRQTRSETY